MKLLSGRVQSGHAYLSRPWEVKAGAIEQQKSRMDQHESLARESTVPARGLEISEAVVPQANREWGGL
jgi:hypothetical protein